MRKGTDGEKAVREPMAVLCNDPFAGMTQIRFFGYDLSSRLVREHPV